MFSGAPYSELPFSEGTFTPLDNSAFEAFLAQVELDRCWILEVDALSLARGNAISAAFSDSAYSVVPFEADEGDSSSGLVTLFWSTHGYTSHADDSPASSWFDGALTKDLNVERSILSEERIGGLAACRASATVRNQDGRWDTLLDDFAIDGRRARLRIGRPTDALKDFGVVFTGVVRSATVGNDLTFEFSDGLAKLELPVQETVYAGSGGTEGGADLKGKPKPEGWGKVFNIAPPLEDSTTLTYRVRFGAIQDVPKVYDRGVELTKVGGVPAPGEYSVDTANGTFRLGATPDGTVTCDAELDASLSGYIEKTGDIVLRILATKAALNSSEIEPGSFGRLNSLVPDAVGIWIWGEVRTIADVVDELLTGIGAFGGFSRFGAFTVGLVAAPEGTADASYTQEMIESVTRESLPSSVDPVIWRALVSFQKNYTVQNDLAASVLPARVMFAAEPFRVAPPQEDASIKSRHLLARSIGPMPGLFADSAGAADYAERLFETWGDAPVAYRVITRLPAMLRDLGDVVHLTFPRHGLSSGRPARVLRHSIRGTEISLGVIA